MISPAKGTHERWWRHLGTYGAGLFLLNALGFVLLPVYTRHLAPGDFGILEVLNRSGEIMRTLVGCGITNAALMFYQFERSDPVKRRQVFPTALFSMVVGGGAIAIAMQCFARPFSRLILSDPRLAWAVGMMIWASLFEIVFGVGLACIQVQVRSGLHVTLTVGRVLLAVVANVYFIVFLRLGLKGAIFALALHTAVFGVIVSVMVIRSQGFSLSRNLLWQMLKYGAPFIAGGGLAFILNNGDRYFLLHYRDAYVVGLYALAYKIGMVASTLVLGAFLRYWGAVMHEMTSIDGGGARLGRVGSYLSVSYMAVALPLAIFSPSLVRLICGKTYGAAAPIVPVILLSYFFWALSTVADTSFYIKRKTIYKPLLLGAATFICCLFYWLLIPPFGMMGAAVATLVGFVTFFTLTWYFANRVFPFQMEWSRLAKLLGVCIALYGIGAWIVARPGWVGLVAAGMVVMLFPFALFAAGFFHPSELEQLRNMCHRPRKSAEAVTEADSEIRSELPR
jgi:O-antigen/teichoic acid export membrane protein